MGVQIYVSVIEKIVRLMHFLAISCANCAKYEEKQVNIHKMKVEILGNMCN